MRPLLALAALGLAVALGQACSSENRAKPYAYPDGGVSTGGGGGIDAGFLDGPPAADASGLCGNLIVPVLTEMPNLYFVVDRSGSMADPLPGASYNKYQNARIAIGKVLRAIGHRVRYGAAVFPQAGGNIEGCGTGKEVFPTQPGDPPTYAANGEDGPVLTALLAALNQTPSGGTPTSPTLYALIPTLTALDGKTFVVLATDGAPNCDPYAQCSADECMLNLEGYSVDDQLCVAPLNCCEESFFASGPLNCVDRVASVQEITKLALAGIPTYVIGMPGSEAYANVLDEMATAGGTARPTPPLYYPVTDSANLTETIKQIGVQVAITCDVKLESPPPDPTLVNVYLDTVLVQKDAENGWDWTSGTSLSLYGEACTKLKSGDVLQLQVVAGCPTSVK